MSKQLADNQDLLAMTHVGEDPEKYMKSVTPPIFMNSLHGFDTVKDYSDSGALIEKKYPGFQKAFRNFCIKCGYDMSDLGGKCPRCGFDFDE